MIEHLDRKLLQLHTRMYTGTGKRLAAPRHQLLVKFMEQLAVEYQAIGELLPAELRSFVSKERK